MAQRDVQKRRVLAVIAVLVTLTLSAATTAAGQEPAIPQSLLDLPDNEADLLKYLQELAAARGTLAAAALQVRPSAKAEFTFALAGVRIGNSADDRSTGFFYPNGDFFSFTCGECAFVVAETGAASVSLDSGSPGIVFKLNQNGTALNATCRAETCRVVTAPETSTIGIQPPDARRVQVLRNSETADIPVTARVLFSVAP